ncbi:hypothetical protein BKA62DRAFT_661354 [Auriculariales sp. MPI-PUGE-AT-0066]|nr:hypothetical protein BKA62DRAFT_661354 [Auriculariales sp. MPI-PUGE-AT-0066]
MAWCDYCDRSFGTPRALWQHIANSPAHECDHCYYHFDDIDDLDDHRHAEHISCSQCDEEWWLADGDALHEHNLRVHGERYCRDCRRVFMGVSQYRSHRNSSKHAPKDNICPYRVRGCLGTFVSAAALALHLESGSCVSGMTRADVNARAIAADRNRVIVDSSRLIGNGLVQTTTYTVTNRAWNGYNWECYLCHATTRSREALNQHLNSPRHEEKIYVCPHSSCQTRFSTLSGFMQHVESDSCGVQRFRLVQDAMAQITKGMRRIAF